MRICVPVKADQGLESVMASNLMVAECFLIIDTQNNSIEKIEKKGLGLNPLKPIMDALFDVLIVDDLGLPAFNKLKERRRRVYKMFGRIVKDNVEMMKKRQLVEITSEILQNKL